MDTKKTHSIEIGLHAQKLTKKIFNLDGLYVFFEDIGYDLD